MTRTTMVVRPYGRRLQITVEYGADWIEMEEIVALEGSEDMADNEVDAAVAAADARLRAPVAEGE